MVSQLLCAFCLIAHTHTRSDWADMLWRLGVCVCVCVFVRLYGYVACGRVVAVTSASSSS